MFLIIGFTVACFFATPGSAIDCYRCNSTGHRECLEKFIKPSSLRPESCSDVFEARYCIKTTGFYAGEVGDQRFCSSRDLGNYCEYIRREGDDREYRTCVYTCDTDACNSAKSLAINFATTVIITLLSTIVAFLQRSSVL